MKNLLDEIIPLRFLVVDDDNSLRKVVTYELKQIGVMKITEATNGSHAWTLLEKSIGSASEFDVVISDWNMPSMSGLELLKKCRAHATLKNIGFMLVTSESETAHVKQAITEGVDNYIVKPVRTEPFQEKLKVLYQKRFGKKG